MGGAHRLPRLAERVKLHFSIERHWAGRSPSQRHMYEWRERDHTLLGWCGSNGTMGLKSKASVHSRCSAESRASPHLPTGLLVERAPRKSAVWGAGEEREKQQNAAASTSIICILSRRQLVGSSWSVL